MKNRAYTAVISVFLTLLITACSEGENKTQATITAPPVNRADTDIAQLVSGGKLFQKHCAQCHGVDGQGADNWRQREPDGLFPPPPLNGTGHAWHHPGDWLFSKIKYGSVPGKGKMPAWGGTLNDDQIAAVMAWFMARWPPEVYEAWSRMERQS